MPKPSVLKKIQKKFENDEPSLLTKPVLIKSETDNSSHQADKSWKVDISQILIKKNLNPDLFNNVSGISLDSPLSEHVAWAFNNIYSFAYPNSEPTDPSIARYHHGITHVVRASRYVKPLINLRIRHGDPTALKLTPVDIKLLELAVLFHDAARENEGEDIWDDESAVLLYAYLRKVLNLDAETAAKIAEAVANKDPFVEGYLTLKEDEDKIHCELVPYDKVEEQKNIFQKIIHDADCLDIIRARDCFDGRYLDFYDDIASTNPKAFQELAFFITEARCLIYLQGDAYDFTKPVIKVRYEQKDALDLIEQDIKSELTLLSILGTEILTKESAEKIIFPYEIHRDSNLQEFTDESLQAKLDNFEIIARSVSTPSAISIKLRKNNEEESMAALEARKVFREPGIPTTSFFDDRNKKNGNPKRSVSLIGYGSSPLSDAGAIIFRPNINDVYDIYNIDAGTYHGKKEVVWITTQSLSCQEKAKKLFYLQRTMQLGGSVRVCAFFTGVKPFAARQNEILMDVKKIDAIYFTLDPNLNNYYHMRDAEATCSASPILQAVFIQNAYEQEYYRKYQLMKDELEIKFPGKSLQAYATKYGPAIRPIVEYSSQKNKIRLFSEGKLSDESIIKLWAEMCSHYITAMLCSKNMDEKTIVYRMTLDDIKTNSMYRNRKNSKPRHIKRNGPADSNYSSELRDKLNQHLTLLKQNLIDDYNHKIIGRIKSGEDILSLDIYMAILGDPTSFYSVKDILKDKICKFLANGIQKENFLIELTETEPVRIDIYDYIFDSKLPIDLLAEERIHALPGKGLYELAKSLRLNDLANLIQQEVSKFLLGQLQIHPNLENDKNLHKFQLYFELLKKILVLAKIFDCFENKSFHDELVKTIDFLGKIVYETMKKSVPGYNPNNLFVTNHLKVFYEYVNYLSSTNQMTVEQFENTKKVHHMLESTVSADLIDINSAHMEIFLKFTKLTHRECDPNLIINWFNESRTKLHPIYTGTILIELIQQVTSLSKEQVLFKTIIKSITDKETNQSRADVCYWLENINHLKNIMPNKKFNDLHLKEIWSLLLTKIPTLKTTMELSTGYRLEKMMRFIFELYSEYPPINKEINVEPLIYLFNEILTSYKKEDLAPATIEKLSRFKSAKFPPELTEIIDNYLQPIMLETTLA